MAAPGPVWRRASSFEAGVPFDCVTFVLVTSFAIQKLMNSAASLVSSIFDFCSLDSSQFFSIETFGGRSLYW